ncbi:Cullin-3 [Maudiozyma exigua]|uniref:Cullin-3 n=1 Tax=Maudiozyma exigua TaxID=34358 RepID=A0A9P6WEY6_MAUEX|nr:Cullin-3 [Kazachstania exigua]
MMSFKRVKIKVPGKLQPTTENFEDSWSILQNVFDKVFKDDTQSISFEKTYRIVYEIVRYRQEAELYSKIKQYLIKKLETIRVETFDRKQHQLQDKWDFLETLEKVWKDTNLHLERIRDLTLYLERSYCQRNRVPGIVETGLEIFSDCVLSPLKDTVNKEYSEGVNDLRYTHVYDNPHTTTLEQLGSMMLTILSGEDSFFVVFVQPYLLEESTKYYSELVRTIDTEPMQGFERIESLIEFETKLDDKFLTSDSVTKIVKCIEKVLIWGNFDKIIAPLLSESLINFDNELLNKLYYLTVDRKYRLKLRHAIQDMIIKNLSAIELDESEKKKSLIGTKWTTAIIEMFNKYTKLLEGFRFEVESNTDDNNYISDDNLSGSQGLNENNNHNLNEDDSDTVSKGVLSAAGLLNETFSNFFKENAKFSSQYMCFYLDSHLKRTLEKTEINNARKDILGCVKLAKLLPDKDEFTVIYKNQLSKRLIQQRSSLEMEKFSCRKINEETGSFLTHKLDTMLRDMTTSADLSKNFNSAQNQKSTETIDTEENFNFVPEILTMTSWPFQNIDSITMDDLILPQQLETIKISFEKFYNKKYNERKLKWAHTLGSIEIGFQFEKTYHNLMMPFHSALIFLLFEKHEELTMENIMEMTNIPEPELNRQLLSLIMSSKSRILKKTPNSKTISKTDKFAINYNFTSATENVKVQTIIGNIPSSRSENSNQSNILERERINTTNAAIVRVMKRNKTLSHNELLEAVTDEVKPIFSLPTSVFKKSLGYLISKEYVQRNPDDPSIYHYIS